MLTFNEFNLLTEGVGIRETDYGTDLHNKKTTDYHGGNLTFFESGNLFYAIVLVMGKNSTFIYRASKTFSDNFDDYIPNKTTSTLIGNSFVKTLSEIFYILLDLGNKLNKKTIIFSGNHNQVTTVYKLVMESKFFIEKCREHNFIPKVLENENPISDELHHRYSFKFVNVDYHD